jgi:hypothetical protein
VRSTHPLQYTPDADSLAQIGTGIHLKNLCINTLQNNKTTQ